MDSISPMFVVTDVNRTAAFYREKLGFEKAYPDPEIDSFFATMRRDGVMIFFKSQSGVNPVPNSSLHPRLKWDAYVYVPDPDALAAELASNGLEFHKPLGDTSEGLRGFEVRDPDGYVLFFGRPVPPKHENA
ncbi:MAG TPA: VOC family protein [Terracidiphilus sp.]|nr:VOC family protein [Terracidiphilus sp.]